MLKLVLLLAVLSVATTQARDICLSDLGCFTDSYPFSGTLQRPMAFLPETPERVGTKFYLFNKNTQAGEQIAADFLGQNFDSSVPTKFIIHGFLHHSKKQWVVSMRNALLNASSTNVVAVDWSRGNGFPYTQATANTQIVGAEIAKLIKAMCAKFTNLSPADFHIIGHSLGAHIAGYVGKRVKGLGRITALDPAGPYFENTDKRVRLSEEDALFVEAIHTDGTANLQLGLGMMQAIGHVDYYPNGGKNQPDCPTTSGKLLTGVFHIVTVDVDGIDDNLACSHSAALHLYTDSVKSDCKYLAYPCQSEADFNAGKCLKCGPKGCNRMGFGSRQDKDLGTLYFNTQSLRSDVFCKDNFAVSLFSNNLPKLTQTRGKFTAFFKLADGTTTSTEVLDNSEVTFKAESTEIRLISLNEKVKSDVESVWISFDKTANLLSSWMYNGEWSFRYVEVAFGEKQRSQKFCPDKAIIESGKTVKFSKC